jgi:hypothetical protein
MDLYGQLFAYDATTKKYLWQMEVFPPMRDPATEFDVLDNYIASIRAIDDDNVEVIDQLGRQFHVNVARRSSREIKASEVTCHQ